MSFGGIVLSIGGAIFTVLQPWIAMGPGILAGVCFSSAWYFSRKERKRDARAAEQQTQKVRQEAYLAQQVQDDAELHIQEIDGRFDDYENSNFMMDERYSDEL